MKELRPTFKTDTLFKLLFTKNQHLLKKLVAHLLKIPVDDISQFDVRNTENTPDIYGKKLCRLDILMILNGEYVNLEVQVKDEGDFPERTLFYWARIYSNSLSSGGTYIKLPKTIIISIVDFPLFDDTDDFHSEFQLLEVSRKTPLTDRQVLHFFELKKLPEEIDENNLLLIWLKLFNANTEEELQMIDDLGVSEISEAITAYRTVTSSEEYQELERIYVKAELDERQRTYNAIRRATAEKDAEIAEKVKENDELRKQIEALKAGNTGK